MQKIESASKSNRPELTRDIQNFWTRNVNAERIMGKSVTKYHRGEKEYFVTDLPIIRSALTTGHSSSLSSNGTLVNL